ncbi:CLIP domain-containing serine protease B8-like [Sabethes cyaneus]|uniref:CLIP domain-containing serine protease B8-like n=1 Tax=Sabethes cyaneus TaxID=53552 RepID=UPI00237D7E50|nr:CLIP domain-containing serine protease B8-like [Sabethes cyaneus]
MRQLQAVAIILLSVLAGATRSELTKPDVYVILGGTIADFPEFPWMAMLLYEHKNSQQMKYNCGGSLISSTFVITAAHCVKGPQYDIAGPLKLVRLGEYDVNSDPDCMVLANHHFLCSPGKFDIPPRSIRVHPSYRVGDRNYRHDLAIVELESSPPLSSFIQPIKLPDEARQTLIAALGARTMFTVAGWGRTDYFTQQLGAMAMSPVKQKVDVPYVDKRSCRRIYRTQRKTLGFGQLCAGGQPGKDACRGDSGSCLMLRDRQEGWVLLGVVSFGTDTCGVQGWPGVYTDLRKYTKWIRANAVPKLFN